MELGLPVPPGFVLTRRALRHFLEQTDLEKATQELLAFPSEERTARTARFQEIRSHVLATDLPEALLEAANPLVVDLLRGSPSGLAVRSSGTHEDSSHASFAGVYDSFLGIDSVAAFWQSVLECWCAAWSPSALDYSTRMGVEPSADSMAVIVQQLIHADSAGVIFTADPRTGNPWRFTLESTFGLSQDLVGGLGTTPADRYVLQWHSGEILTKEIARKETRIVASAHGVTCVPLDHDLSTCPSLGDELATQIAEIALQIDRAFECRVDIEWVVQDGEIHIVQTRPISALPSFFPHDMPDHFAVMTWRQPDRMMRRFLWWFWSRASDSFVTPPLYRELLLVEQHNRYQLGAAPEALGRLAAIDMDFAGHRYVSDLDDGTPLSATDMEAYLCEYEPELRRGYLNAKHSKFPAILDRVDELLRRPCSVSHCIDAVLWARDVKFDLFCYGMSPGQALHGITLSLLNEFLQQYAPGCDADYLVQGHHPDLDPYYPQTQVEQAEDLARLVESGAMRRAFISMDAGTLLGLLREEFSASPFMAAFDDSCRQNGVLMSPWNSGPELDGRHREIITMVQVTLGSPSRAHVRHLEAVRRREERVTKVRDRLADEKPETQARFDCLLDQAWFWGPALNDRAGMGVVHWRIEELWGATLSALQDENLCDKPDDIVYCTTEDLAQIKASGVLEGRRIIAQHRVEHERFERLAPPEILGQPQQVEELEGLSEQTEPPNRESGSAEGRIGCCIQGTTWVAGTCQGRAFKVSSITDIESMDSSQVLLLRQPAQLNNENAATMLSVILRVGGIVAVAGPTMLMIHLSQIARECGVPIVQIEPADMDLIPDGTMLWLDGRLGTVTLAPSDE